MPVFHGATVGQGVFLNTPDGDGTVGQIMETDGSGSLSFRDPVQASASTIKEVTIVGGNYNIVADDSNKILRIAVASTPGTITFNHGVFAAGEWVSIINPAGIDPLTITDGGSPVWIYGDRRNILGLVTVIYSGVTDGWYAEGNCE